MATNFTQPGDRITIAAPRTVTSGAGVQVGALFGVALHDAANGATLTIARDGIFTLPKATPLVMAVGDRLWWDNTNFNLNKTATSQYQVAVCTVAALSADTTVTCVLEIATPSGT